MLSVFEDVHDNNFVRLSSGTSLAIEEADASNPDYLAHGEIVPIAYMPRVTPDYNSGYFELTNVPVIAPSGDVVCPRLSIKVCIH